MQVRQGGTVPKLRAPLGEGPGNDGLLEGLKGFGTRNEHAVGIVGQVHDVAVAAVKRVKNSRICRPQGRHGGVKIGTRQGLAWVSGQAPNHRLLQKGPKGTVLVGPKSVVEHGILHAKGREVGVVGLACVFMGGIGPHKPVFVFAQLQAVLKKLYAPKAKPVIALIHRSTRSVVQGINPLDSALASVVHRGAHF